MTVTFIAAAIEYLSDLCCPVDTFLFVFPVVETVSGTLHQFCDVPESYLNWKLPASDCWELQPPVQGVSSTTGSTKLAKIDAL